MDEAGPSIVISSDEESSEEVGKEDTVSEVHCDDMNSGSDIHKTEPQLTTANTDPEGILKQFLDRCKLVEGSKYMEVIISKVWKEYHNAKSSYVRSEEFINLVLNKINQLPRLPYSSVKEIVVELQYHRDSKRLKSSTSRNENNNVNDASSDTGASKTIDKEKEKRREKNLRRLKKMLWNLRERIKRLEEAEIGSSDDEESSYIQLCRYKERFCKVHNKICEFEDIPSNAGRTYLQKIRFSGTDCPKLNKAIERFYNKTRSFPDFTDIFNAVKKVNSEENLGLADLELRKLAEKAFTELGNELQSLRQLDFYDTFNSYLSDADDPADHDPELERKLNENKMKYHDREKEVLQQFVDKMKDHDEDEDEDTGNDEDEEEEEEKERDSYGDDDDDDEEEEEKEEKEEDDNDDEREAEENNENQNEHSDKRKKADTTKGNDSAQSWINENSVCKIDHFCSFPDDDQGFRMVLEDVKYTEDWKKYVTKNSNKKQNDDKCANIHISDDSIDKKGEKMDIKQLSICSSEEPKEIKLSVPCTRRKRKNASQVLDGQEKTRPFKIKLRDVRYSDVWMKYVGNSADKNDNRSDPLNCESGDAIDDVNGTGSDLPSASVERSAAANWNQSVEGTVCVNDTNSSTSSGVENNSCLKSDNKRKRELDDSIDTKKPKLLDTPTVISDSDEETESNCKELIETLEYINDALSRPKSEEPRDKKNPDKKPAQEEESKLEIVDLETTLNKEGDDDIVIVQETIKKKPDPENDDMEPRKSDSVTSFDLLGAVKKLQKNKSSVNKSSNLPASTSSTVKQNASQDPYMLTVRSSGSAVRQYRRPKAETYSGLSLRQYHGPNFNSDNVNNYSAVRQYHGLKFNSNNVNNKNSMVNGSTVRATMNQMAVATSNHHVLIKNAHSLSMQNNYSQSIKGQNLEEQRMRHLQSIQRLQHKQQTEQIRFSPSMQRMQQVGYVRRTVTTTTTVVEESMRMQRGSRVAVRPIGQNMPPRMTVAKNVSKAQAILPSSTWGSGQRATSKISTASSEHMKSVDNNLITLD